MTRLAWLGRLTVVSMLAGSSACAERDAREPGVADHLAGTPADTTAVLAAAREVMAAARFATLVTLGPDGHPQARIVDPFPAEADFTIWVGTNPRSRKVAEVRADSRVTLLYFDREGASYVTVIGIAEPVTDLASRRRFWKEEWAPFYPGGAVGPDYLLLNVRPIRLEVSAERLGIRNDSVTWRPAIVRLP